MKALAILTAAIVLSACTEEGDNADSGYNDGYAVGYNSICHPNKSNLIYGHDSAEYRNAYADGHADGVADCKAKNR